MSHQSRRNKSEKSVHVRLIHIRYNCYSETVTSSYMSVIDLQERLKIWSRALGTITIRAQTLHRGDSKYSIPFNRDCDSIMNDSDFLHWSGYILSWQWAIVTSSLAWSHVTDGSYIRLCMLPLTICIWFMQIVQSPPPIAPIEVGRTVLVIEWIDKSTSIKFTKILTSKVSSISFCLQNPNTFWRHVTPKSFKADLVHQSYVIVR